MRVPRWLHIRLPVWRLTHTCQRPRSAHITHLNRPLSTHTQPPLRHPSLQSQPPTPTPTTEQPEKPEGWESRFTSASTFRKMLYRAAAGAWEAGVTPGAVIRGIGPLGPRLVGGYVGGRFSHHGQPLNDQEVAAFRWVVARWFWVGFSGGRACLGGGPVWGGSLTCSGKRVVWGFRAARSPLIDPNH